MSSERLAMAEDSDSDGSEVTANSTSESNESLGDNIEVAKILDQKFHLPKDLCEHSEIFREFFSIDTWNQLTSDERSNLSNLLPTFPENDEHEKQETVQQLFANTLTRFSQSPLDVFHNNLQDGNYRPDIAHYRKSILKAEEREQRIRECERISLLAEKLVCSREKLLRSAYRCPAGSFPQLPHSSASVPRLSSSSATMRANRRYFQEISKLTEELGFAVSDDETIPEVMQTHLTKKQIKQFSEQGSLSPGAETRIISTTATKEKTWDHLTNATVTDARYKTMLQSYRKRKMIEPDHPDMEIEEIELKDICARTQLTVNPKKLINASVTRKSMLIDTSRIKQEAPTYTVMNRFPVSNSNQLVGKNMKVANRNIAGRMSIQDRNIKRMGSQSETDEEDWIKTNIIKVEPKTEGVIRVAGKGDPKLPMKQAKIKTIYPQHSGTVVMNRKRPIVDNSQARAGKKIIIDAGNVIKSPFTAKNSGVVQNKRIVINSRPTVVMDPNDLIDETDGNDIDNSPESRHERQACFLSLIRDIFCSTRDHRMKLEELRNRINVWLSNPVASMNEWYQVASDWGVLLISAVHFLSGEFQDQPDDFVPYLEFKSHLNIYQWIGASRDTDARMKPLCQYWLSRRNEMGIKAINLLKPKTLNKTLSPEKNEENHLQQAVSPPNARCRTDWKVQQASEEDLIEFQSQERHRYENPHLPFTYRQHGYESVVGPIRGIYSQSPAATKARDHNMLIADRPNFVTILALVRDAAARLPNGEGTRWDICELLKSSQYIAQGTTDVVIQSIVSGALDRMHTEFDPCIKYDTKRKLWIYVHRNRTENEFERLHLQQQEINRQKKPVFRKTKIDSPQQMITISSSSMRVVPSSSVRTYQTKAIPSTSNTIKTVPALTTFETKQRIQNQSSPPPLKISPKRYIKMLGNERSMEAIDVEASLDAHTTPIVKNSDPKTRISLKNVSHMSPMRIITSSPATSSYVQSSPVLSSAQSIFINSNRSQSPKVGTFVNARKVGGKPVIISQNQAPPLVSQSSPNTNQNYVIPAITSAAKVTKSDPPSFSTTTGKSSQFQQKNFIKVNPTTGKNLNNPQQKIILTSASALQSQKGGKVITVPKSQSPVTMLSQQKQILTNVIVQQQKAKGQNQMLMANNQQKMPGLTISTSNANSSPQVIQIQQSSADGKLTTVSPANLTPQQRQTIFQSLKQFKQGGNQQTMIVKPQIVKSIANDVQAPPLVSVSGSAGKILKSGTTTMVQQPQVIVPMTQKVVPKTTFKIAGGNASGQSGSLIQIAGTPGSPMAQYAVVSKGKGIISLNQTKMITTQANTSNQNIVTSTGNVILSQSQIQQMSPSQQNLPTSQNQPIKIVQSGSITAQQLIGAKLINVQSLANKGIKTTGGIKMINSQNYIANIGGKPLIIANKSNAAGGNSSNQSGQGLVLQASNSPNGAFILNSQGQQLKVQGNILTQGNVNMLNQPITSQPQTVMLGNQIVKVQSINQMQQKVNAQPNTSGVNNQDGQRPIILGSTIKVLKNVIKPNTQPQQQQRVVLAAPSSQSGQFSQQIILPANFQGLKSLQGLKVIPMGQQGSSDRVFTTRLVTNSSATTTNNNNSNKPVTNSQEDAKE